MADSRYHPGRLHAICQTLRPMHLEKWYQLMDGSRDESSAKPIAVVLLGMPGAGKGTQAQRLAAIGWRHLNVGGLVRTEVAARTEWGRRAASLMYKGELLPSLDIQQLLSRHLAVGPFPVVVEGYPRRLEEAGTVAGFCGPDAVEIPVLLEVSQSASLVRLTNRLTCADCGNVGRTGEGERCAVCGGTLAKRNDDDPQAVLRRLEIYQAETVPLIARYASTGELETVDASQDELAIHKDLVRRIALRTTNGMWSPDMDMREN